MYIDIHTHNSVNQTAGNIHIPRSFGIHPWEADRVPFDEHLFPDDLELLGECGLDRCCQVPWAQQQTLFEQQLMLAERRQLPVVIHCVRAYDELLALRQRYHATPWVIHGFLGPAQQAEQLWRKGIAISLGAALLDPRRAKVHETLRQRYGSQPLFLETDDSPIAIQQVYQAAAQLLDLTVEKLMADIATTYQTLIGNPQPFQ